MYILTKTGIFDTSKYEFICDDGDYITYACKNNHKSNGQGVTSIRKKCIIKQDEDLFKLCEEFVVRYTNEKKPKSQDLNKVINTLKENDSNLSHFVRFLFDYYGEKLEFVKLGIWTTKGLIYVVEYNKEGEPKLL